MDWVATIAGGIGNLFSGGALGLIGTALSAWTKFKERAQTHEFEMEKMKVDLDIARVEADGAIRTAELGAEQQALEGSYKEASARWSTGQSSWLIAVDFIRGITRPLLTWFGLTSTILVIYLLWETMPVAAQKDTIDQLMILTSTMVTWWFGARHIRK